jgi:aspartate racemase
MGPLAGVDLQKKIILATTASHDQDHIKVIHYCDPQIPDRTEALMKGGEYVSHLIASLNRLAPFSPHMVFIACNTAHACIEKIRAESRVPVVSMIEVLAGYLHTKDVTRVGLLATTGTLESRVYHNALEPLGVQVCVPERSQEKVMKAIYDYIKKGVMTGVEKEYVHEAIGELVAQGVQKIIMGCSEIPLLYAMNDILVDPAQVVAEYVAAQRQLKLP